MKSIRLLPMLALLAGIVFSAFTPVTTKNAGQNENFYRFMSTDPNDRLLESAYEYIGTQLPDPTGCDGDELTCIIHALGDTDEPDFQASGISTLQDLEDVTDALKDVD